ncbi:MAG: DMT family transporter [Parvularculaceae bacterium]
MDAWVLLACAIGFEVLGTSLLKLSDGFAKPLFGVLAIAAYSTSFWFLAPALKTIPVGVAYAIWAGVGIVAVAAIGAAAFGQTLSAPQYGFMALVLIGAVGLRVTTAG